MTVARTVSEAETTGSRAEPAALSRVFIGADVGGTTISAGLVSETGEVLSVIRKGTRSDGAGTAAVTLTAVIDDLVAEAGRRSLLVGGIGIGLPGLVDADRGMMVSASNLVSEFANLPIADHLRSALGVPVFVDNDVNALALGEWTFGVGRGARSLALLAIGTGVGGAIIADGKLLRGEGGAAGEFGHVPIDFQGPPCLCGGHGCLCLYVGGPFLARVARVRVEAGEPSRLVALAGGDPRRIDSRLVFEAAAAGDPLASELVERGCDALGAGIAVIVNSLDPGLVIVTGGVAGSFVLLEADVQRAARRYALPHVLNRTRIRIAGSDKRRTVVGGAALALYELGRRAPRMAVPAAGPS